MYWFSQMSILALNVNIKCQYKILIVAKNWIYVPIRKDFP